MSSFRQHVFLSSPTSSLVSSDVASFLSRVFSFLVSSVSFLSTASGFPCPFSCHLSWPLFLSRVFCPLSHPFWYLLSLSPSFLVSSDFPPLPFHVFFFSPQLRPVSVLCHEWSIEASLSLIDPGGSAVMSKCPFPLRLSSYELYNCDVFRCL